MSGSKAYIYTCNDRSTHFLLYAGVGVGDQNFGDRQEQERKNLLFADSLSLSLIVHDGITQDTDGIR